MPLKLLFLAALLLFAAAGAEAATFCVSTGNQLNSALNTASLNQEDDVIKIEYGTLTTNVHAPETYQWQYTPTAGAPSEYSLTISGGWSRGNNCQTVFTNDPSQTVLDAQYFGPVFVADLRWDFSGIFTLRNLTFTRGRAFPSCIVNNTTVNGCPVSGLHIEAWALIGAQVVVDNVLVVAGMNAPSAHASISRLYMTNGFLRLRNSIFAANTLTSSGTNTRGVEVLGAGSAILFVSNNSVFNNAVRTRETGFIAGGVATFTNNAVGDNTTIDAQNYQFYANQASGVSLRDNHFQTRSANGFFAQDIGTTTGDPGWTQTGIRMIPDIDSPLRDSGENQPAGGALSIDFSGGPRIVNGTIDRGAVEASAPPPTGPMLSASTPANGSTTSILGINNTSVSRTIQFTSSGGTPGGTTQLTCSVNSGTAQVTINATQSIATGGFPQAVTVSLPVTTTPVTHVIGCTALRMNAPTQSFTFNYVTATTVMMSSGFED